MRLLEKDYHVITVHLSEESVPDGRIDMLDVVYSVGDIMGFGNIFLPYQSPLGFYEVLTDFSLTEILFRLGYDVKEVREDKNKYTTDKLSSMLREVEEYLVDKGFVDLWEESLEEICFH